MRMKASDGQSEGEGARESSRVLTVHDAAFVLQHLVSGGGGRRRAEGSIVRRT